MIDNKLITETDIPTLDLIYGEMKNRMYQAQSVLEDLSDDNLTVPYYEGLLDAYGFVYTEIDRIMNLRGERK
jgi:hypothetical protein